MKVLVRNLNLLIPKSPCLDHETLANSQSYIASQSSTSRQAPTSKISNPPQRTQSISAKQNDHYRAIQNGVTSAAHNTKTLVTPQPALASASSALSIGLQSLAIRPRNATSSPKRPQSPTREATNNRQQQPACRSLEEQQLPARCNHPPFINYLERETTKLLLGILDDASQSDNQLPSSPQRTAAESQSTSRIPASSHLPTHQEDRPTTAALPSGTPTIPSTIPQQLLDTSLTSQHVQPSLPSTTDNLDLPDQDDIFDNNRDWYEGSAEDTENEESRESRLQGKAHATERRSPYAQHARTVSRHLYSPGEGTSNPQLSSHIS